MKKITIFLAFAISSILSFGQNTPSAYFDLIKKADSLYKVKDFKQSAFTYSSAFKVNDWKGMLNDRYNAACSWAKANYPDSAFYNLNRIATVMNFADYEHISIDSDLTSLHSDKRWKQLLKTVKKNKDKIEEKYNWTLIKQLDTVYENDQKCRLQIDTINNLFGADSKEMQTQWKIIAQKDSINLIQIKHILDNFGWLGSDIISEKGNTTLFLVIQHTDVVTQEHYLPMLRDAVKNGNAPSQVLALLEDRVALRQGKKQIYGSQIGIYKETKPESYFVAPLEDPDNVDKRRADVGLEPLAEYVKRWQIIWDIEKYKKELPIIEAKEKTGQK